MTVEDFSTTLLCLTRVCWAAAAGELHLASGSDQEEEEEEGDTQLVLRLGICGKNKVSTGKVSHCTCCVCVSWSLHLRMLV